MQSSTYTLTQGNNTVNLPGPTNAPVLGTTWDIDVYEKDFFSPDDPVGGGTVQGGQNQANINVNCGPRVVVSGTNGEAQTSGGEGQCIELYVKATYQVPVAGANLDPIGMIAEYTLVERDGDPVEFCWNCETEATSCGCAGL